ncbi:MAG: MucR family transcriptional regulator [Methylobacterium sp.]|jgi:predicted transcriptional regulator|uniref:MucR family transcriptional regulator n=1 Tax=unclassified Methylobacterium TaxID=2615210 RepID=UPI0009E846E7|nr:MULTISPECIES: MucR family transcriptional regulator [unclassified Methylobacterium]MDO9428555.1 MucR family transcriptional regulator [Methylobacterium sp.]TXM67526.1 MucR family transcriptional regulator [Methylobacterium sp. WL69]
MTDHRPAATGACIDLTEKVVSAYLSNNAIQAAELPVLIRNVCVALMDLGDRDARGDASEDKFEKLKPAQIRKSITPDGLVSFIDGKSYKTLKRHLTKHGLDPDTYRERFGLPMDYPMVAPSYAANRSALAIASGFGTKDRHARQTPDRTVPRSQAVRKSAAA